jgi:hypothetical protein
VLHGLRDKQNPELIAMKRVFQAMRQHMAAIARQCRAITCLIVLVTASAQFAACNTTIGPVDEHPYGQYTDVPSALKNPQDVRVLSIIDEHMEYLTPRVGEMTNLYSLRMDNTGLRTLPDELAACQGIWKLSLPKNGLLAIPFVVFKLKNIESMFLNNNLISDIPGSIGKLQKLEFLELDSNRIESVPLELFDITSLRQIRLKGNRIATFPGNLTKKYNLEYLDLTGNPITPDELQRIRALFPNAEVRY